MRISFALLLATFLLFSFDAESSYPRVLFDREPNDTPEQAQRFRGEAQLVGDVSSHDVDMYWWAVDDRESDRLWTVELIGESDHDIQVRFFWPAEEEEPGGTVQQFGTPSEVENSAAGATRLLDLQSTERRPVATLSRLIVPPGEHLIAFETDGAAGSYRLTLTEGRSVRVRDSVNPGDAEEVVAGPGRDWYFQLNVDEATIGLDPDVEADSFWRVEVFGELGASLEAYIETAEGERLGRSVSGSPLQQQFGRLDLATGSRLRVRHTGEENIGRIGIRLDEDGQKPRPRAESEAVATSLAEALWFEPDTATVVELAERQRSFMAFSVDEGQSGAGWAIDADGDIDRGFEVCLGEIGGRDPVCRNGPAQALFQDMQLAEGDYYLRLRPGRRLDEPTPVELLLRRTAPPTAHQAVEPNDDPDWSAPLRPDQPLTGHFGVARSAWFELLVTGSPQLWRLQADGENLDRLTIQRANVRGILAEQRRGRRAQDPGMMRLDQTLLTPGQYRIRLDGEQTEYRITATPQGAPDRGREVEPNDDERTATALYPGELMRGALHGATDKDYYFFHLPGWNRLVLNLEPPAGGSLDVDLVASGERLLRASVDAGDGALHHASRVPPGDYYLVVSGQAEPDADYRLHVDIEAPWLNDEPDALVDANLDAELHLAHDRVPPFLDRAQRLPVRLTVTNHSDRDHTLPVESHTSHSGGQVIDLPAELVMAPGQTRELDFVWQLPPGISDEMKAAIFVRVGNEILDARVGLDTDTDPVAPLYARPMPESLMGLVDLAWHALGAAFIDPDSGEVVDERYQGRRMNANFLIDGLSAGGSALNWSQEPGQPLPPIRLAGDGGAVHGLMFNQRSPFQRISRWREIEILHGDDHRMLTPLITVELDSEPGAQYFELETPVRARYLQIRPLSRWGASRGAHGTGLFRALGRPEGELADRRHDLLETALGGHWIYSLPSNSRVMEFPQSRQAHNGLPIRGRNLEVVYAFLQHRAARLGEIHWIEDPDHQGVPVERIRVATAVNSPVGPWQKTDDWRLTRDSEGRASFHFEQPARARYLKLEIVEPERGETRDERRWRMPESVEIIEADTLGSGQSILGHWGMDDDHGPMEAGGGSEGDEQAWSIGAIDDRDSHPEAPRQLNERVTGRVAEPGDTRSYRIELAEPDNALELVLNESVSGRLRVRLTGPGGEQVPVAWSREQGHRRKAGLDGLAAGSYQLDVIEPPRSVVFIWDGSGSVAAHQPAIYQAINRFAQGLKPGRDVANMMALGGPMLIDGWAEYPAEVITALSTYDDRFSSSDSEPSLQIATRALEQRDGERVIFLMTDAEMHGRELTVWNDLKRVGPRIITLETNHGRRTDSDTNRWYQNLMRTWARVANGEYHYTTGRTDLIRAFEGAMSRLRQPTEFALTVDRDYREPPRPGRLQVIEGDVPVVGAGVVHLIFDASGSMLRRMEGGRRIDVAKRIVSEVLDDRIPPQVPIALRSYGHTEPHSCETELLVAPSVDNHGAVRRAVNEIQAINLARTPLAASLEAVLDDLSGFSDQERLVVMLTDGEETCDGDVEQSVADLIEAGVNVRLNIVGFHIDELGLQADFERFAEQGGGEYFDSQDGDELIEGLIQSLAARFRLMDGADNEVGRGRVGDEAMVVDAGDYELIVDGSDGEIRHSITIGPEQVVTIRLSDAHDG